jgi:SH3-like domain-containing protein
MKTIFHISVLILVCLTTACTLNQAAFTDPASGPAAWIDAPLDGSSLPLAETQVTSHASDPSGITGFELSVDGNVFHTDPVSADQAGNTIAHISQAWLPDKAGVYMLSIRAANKAGVYGPYAYARVTVGRVTDTPAASPTPVSTSTPTSTPTLSILLAIGLENTNCHDGPGTGYHSSDVLMKGKSVPVDGISQDKNWVRVRRPDGSNGDCWLYLPGIQVTGDLGGLHTYLAPTMTPTATSVATRTRPPRPSPTH